MINNKIQNSFIQQPTRTWEYEPKHGQEIATLQYDQNGYLQGNGDNILIVDNIWQLFSNILPDKTNAKLCNMKVLPKVGHNFHKFYT